MDSIRRKCCGNIVNDGRKRCWNQVFRSLITFFDFNNGDIIRNRFQTMIGRGF
ncbi:MAG TPA: hypothetical protein ENK06_10540 [Gammaproteobacteria bacterium]|nr:hypothetical protein [Gammaproteobacteria bacterium]